MKEDKVDDEVPPSKQTKIDSSQGELFSYIVVSA